MNSALGERAARERRADRNSSKDGHSPNRKRQTTQPNSEALARGTAKDDHSPNRKRRTTQPNSEALARGTAKDDPSPNRKRRTTQPNSEALARGTAKAQPNSGATTTQPNTEALARGSYPTQHTTESLARGRTSTKVCTELPPATASDIQAESDGEEMVGPAIASTKQEKISERRNRERVEHADAVDQKLLSKYLPATIDEFLPNKIPGPDDSFTPPAWLMRAIEEVMVTDVPIPKAPPVRFDLSKEAIQHNTELLMDCNLDMHQLLSQHQDTTLGFGSEFRPVDQMAKILGQHPNFAFFSEVLVNGMDYRFKEELSEDERKAELDAMILRGNHQSVKEDSAEVAKLLAKDVLHGFSLPISPDVVTGMPKAMVQPAGVVKQFSLQEDGSRILKRRLTQDLSFPLTFRDASINNRIDMDAYTEMIYGWCLTRIIHFIVALRLAYPLLPIFIVKYDYSDAYRRIAHAPSAAAQSIIIFAGVAYIALRLTFGGSLNPRHGVPFQRWSPTSPTRSHSAPSGTTPSSGAQRNQKHLPQSYFLTTSPLLGPCQWPLPFRRQSPPEQTASLMT
jgi:hypothetical protein